MFIVVIGNMALVGGPFPTRAAANSWRDNHTGGKWAGYTFDVVALVKPTD